MKIIVVSTPIFKLPCIGYSGLEHLAWLTAKGLAERGHKVSLIAPDGSECPGVEIVPIGPERQVDERMAYNSYWPLLLEADCIIEETWNKWAYVLKMEGKLKAPVLGILHAPVNTMYQVLPEVEKPCFVCISEDQKNHFEALFSKPARVCRNGIDTSFYRPLGIPRSDRYLFLARFSSIKGADLGIQACKEAGVGLDLVGDTTITNEPEYLQKCLAMCDGKQIRVIGGVSRGECVWWFSQAKCTLHPNLRFREPFGLAPVESQACGSPVIAWNYGAMRETIRVGETGFLVQTMEGLVETIREIERGNFLEQMRPRCLENAQNFTVKKMIDGYEKLATEAVANGGW